MSEPKSCRKPRESYRRTRCIAIHEEAILSNGRSPRRSVCRNPLDQLIHEEDCRKLAAKLEQLSNREKSLLLTLTSDGVANQTLGTISRQEGICIRTVYRRREELCNRLRRELEG
jgi:hypothetical protein